MWTQHPAPAADIVASVKLAPDGSGRVLSGGTGSGSSYYGSLLVWDGLTGETYHSLSGLSSVNCVDWHPTSTLVVGGGTSRKAIVYSVETGTTVSEFTGHSGGVPPFVCALFGGSFAEFVVCGAPVRAAFPVARC